LAKQPRTVYLCRECGSQASKWAGRCADCGQWNTLEAEVIERQSAGMALVLAGAEPVALDKVETTAEARFSTGLPELDRVLGGGIVPGSLILLGGAPGIGKSTLLLQICRQLAHLKVLYVSGEESPRQIRLRADRLDVKAPNLLLLAETRLEAIEAQIGSVKPDLVLIDSIQTLFKSDLAPAPGSVTQVRECAAGLMRTAKNGGIPVILVGHVTKDGQLAGPRVLEHLVDTVLYFEGEGDHDVRALRAVKNRFGAAHEIGLFQMAGSGLLPIPDASGFFLSQRASGTSGSLVFPSLEGSRPVLVEIQALVNASRLPEKGVPAVRRCVGLDQNRLSLLLAVLARRCHGMSMADCDVYANAAGGLKLQEPGLDLALALAIASSKRDEVLDPHLAACGEIGLGGEIRAVTQLEIRMKELSKLGFKRCLVPAVGLRGLDLPGLRPLIPIGVGTIKEALEIAGLARERVTS